MKSIGVCFYASFCHLVCDFSDQLSVFGGDLCGNSKGNWSWIVILMGNGGDIGCCVFPLTSLQIGDLQSYLADLSLFLATESNKLYILVDNRPWLKGLGSRPAHFWQLMVTKSRLSPFANTSARKQRKFCKEKSEEVCSQETDSTKRPERTKSSIPERWFSLIDAATLSQKTALLPVKKLKYSLQLNHELHRTLFGLIVFEVSWDDVRGLNYLNELQTDTSLAVETKFMRRWEFDSIVQAVGCISSWFTGTEQEQILLKEYLLSTVEDVFYDVEDKLSDDEANHFYDVGVENSSPYGVYLGFDSYSESIEDDASVLHTPPPPNIPYKRRKVTRSDSPGIEVGTHSEETPKASRGFVNPLEHSEPTVEATEYRDVLLLFKFDDRDLPFKLRDIVISDLRLLTLLEAGLPPWVIFLQSYPVFCHLYRPWMCPLARALYVIISIITVVIGFYDLYKNVPLLKATASRLFGPLFDWIETWEMVSRIKYLGTMLFLHNCEKAIMWFLMVTRSIKSFFSVLAHPIIEPLVEFSKYLLPLWTLCIHLSESFFSFVGILIGSSWNFIGDIVEILLLPIWLILSFLWTVAMSVILPIFWFCWEIFYAPVRLVLALSSFIAFACTLVYETLGELWSSASSILRIASAADATVATQEASMWRVLWNDLFSKVFRALRSILNGFVAFFAACNRHRLSIYNHLKEFLRKLSRQSFRSNHMHSQRRKKQIDLHPHSQICGIHKSVESSGRQTKHAKRLYL